MKLSSPARIAILLSLFLMAPSAQATHKVMCKLPIVSATDPYHRPIGVAVGAAHFSGVLYSALIYNGTVTSTIAVGYWRWQVQNGYSAAKRALVAACNQVSLQQPGNTMSCNFDELPFCYPE